MNYNTSSHATSFWTEDLIRRGYALYTVGSREAQTTDSKRYLGHVWETPPAASKSEPLLRKCFSEALAPEFAACEVSAK